MKLNLCGTTLIQQLILQIIIGLIVAANTGIVKAQLTPDNTVGSTTRSDTVNGLNSDIIEGGATRGTNLFHSFTNFNVDAGKGVYFSNPVDINNILTRVTGSSQSNIFGTLGVLGNANLFLINPNGISFGPNAQLDVKGSFVASTADKIVFDNYEFTTTNPTAPPLLTVNIPLGLGFRNNPGDIIVKDSNLSGSGLGVPQDKILRLNAGYGKVIFDNGGILSRGSQVILEGGDVSLTNDAFIDVSASGGGSITINSGNLTIENSRLIAGIDAFSGSANAQAGDIKINNSGLFTLHNSSVSNNVGLLGSGSAGDIRIDTLNLIVDHGFISTDAYNENSNTFGIAGNIYIYSNDVTVKNRGWISSDVSSDAGQGQNDGGLIFIQTNTLNLENGGYISADTFGSGNGGYIGINTSNLNLENGGVISTSTYGQGSAGYIDINATNSINISGYAKDENNQPIFDRSFPLTDNQGNVIYFENKLAASRIESEVKTFATGNGGYIGINTSNLNLENGGVISTSTYGQGSAGYIDINATNSINISGYAKDENNQPIFDRSFPLTDNQGNVIYFENKLAASRIESEVKTFATGNGGYIGINTSNLNLENGGVISTSTYSQGSAGFIDINATNSINISGYAKDENNQPIFDRSFPLTDNQGNVIYDNQGNVIYFENKLAASRIESEVKTFATGNGGYIGINTSNLNLENGGVISTSTYSQGSAGFIDINATNSINISGYAKDENNQPIFDRSFPLTDNQGNVIYDNQGNVIYFDNKLAASRIESEVKTFAKDNGGLIDINTSNLNLENGGVISTSTYGQGSAGNISIEADNIISNNGFISSDVESGATGNAGDIDLKAGSLSLTNGGGITSLIRGYETLRDGTIVKQQGKGNGGKITIKAGDINIKGVNDNNIGSQINTGTGGIGNAGDIDITASNITIDDKGFLSSLVYKDGAGKGGNIKITTSNLTLENGGFIDASTYGIGDAGAIDITANDITIDQSGVGNIVGQTARGMGNNIKITTSNLTLENGSQITTDTRANGDAGNIKLDITDNLKLTNSTISSGATLDSTGKAGNINIDPTLIELDSSQITVNSQGSGDGGNITLIGNNLNLNNSTISASTKSGQGGNITLNIPDTIRQNNSKIEASAGENGNGGNVTINTNFIIGNGGENRISANAKQGRGGNIKITTQGIFGYKDNQISASSETGVNGVVDTKTPEVDPSQGLIDLPENLLTAAIVTNSCRQGQSSQNSLIVKGRGGLALTSDQLPSSSEVEVSLIAPTSVTSSSAINSTSTNMEKTAFKTIIPAQGWEINSQGDVVLVAHSTGNPAERVNTAITCASN